MAFVCFWGLDLCTTCHADGAGRGYLAYKQQMRIRPSFMRFGKSMNRTLAYANGGIAC